MPQLTVGTMTRVVGATPRGCPGQARGPAPTRHFQPLTEALRRLHFLTTPFGDYRNEEYS